MDQSLWWLLTAGALLAGLFAAGVRHRLRARRKATDRPRVVLAIGAHPDDIEFGCGAALRRYREAGYRTHGLILSCGEAGLDRVAGEGTRVQEAKRGARVMKLESLTVLNFPDTQLQSRREDLKRAIEECMRLLSPDAVLTHNRHDLHGDHRTVFAATIEAGRHVPNVLCYENPNTPAHFKPNFFVDVSRYLDAKIAALNCHASQRRKPYFSPHLVRSMARVRGNQGLVEFAEGFEAIRMQSGSL